MYSITQQGNTITTYLQELVCDQLVDIDELPTDIPVGSTCIVLENSSVWMLGNDKVWHEL